MEDVKKGGDTFTTIRKQTLNLSGFKQDKINDKVMKSFGLTEEEINELKKGDVDSNFKGYAGDKQIRIKKTGKDIKAGLAKKNAELTARKNVIDDKASTLLSDIKTLGCNAVPDYITWEAREFGEDAPKIFGWEARDSYSIPYSVQQKLKEPKAEDACEEKGSDVIAMNVVQPQNAELSNQDKIKWMRVQKIRSKMEEFNGLIETSISIKKDLDIINTMINNLDDKTSYELTIGQLKSAGL